MNEAAPPDIEELLRRTYAAINAKDIDAGLATMHPNVDWPYMLTGRIHGRDAVRAYWSKHLPKVNAHLDLRRITVVAGNRIAVEGRQQLMDDDGNVLADHTVRRIFSFRDGLISRMDIAGF